MTSDSPNNPSGYRNPEFDSLMKKAETEPDRAKRISYLHEAEKILADEMPVCPVYFYSNVVMESPRVKGIYLSPTGVVFFRGAEIN